MGPRRTRSAPTWSLLLFAACAASSPSLPRALTIHPGERTRIAVSDLASGRIFALQNQSAGSRDEVYGEANGNSMVKVVSDQQLQQLLDVLAAQGMFAHAGNAAVPGARAAIAIDSSGGRIVWSRPTPAAGTLDEVHAFEAGRGYVLALYNSETSYHLGTIDSFDPATRARIQSESERAKAATSRQGPPK